MSEAFILWNSTGKFLSGCLKYLPHFQLPVWWSQVCQHEFNPWSQKSSFYLPSCIFISFHPPFALVLHTPTPCHWIISHASTHSALIHPRLSLTCLCLKHLALFPISPLKAITLQWEQSFWGCDPPASPGCFMNNSEGAQIVLWVPWWRVSQVTFKTLRCLNPTADYDAQNN